MQEKDTQEGCTLESPFTFFGWCQNRNGQPICQVLWHSDLFSIISGKNIYFLSFFRCTDVPVLNQIEFNPYCVDQDILEYCKENKIIVQAYSPLGSDPGRNAAKNQTRVLEHETMVNMIYDYSQHSVLISTSIHIQLWKLSWSEQKSST